MKITKKKISDNAEVLADEEKVVIIGDNGQQVFLTPALAKAIAPVLAEQAQIAASLAATGEPYAVQEVAWQLRKDAGRLN